MAKKISVKRVLEIANIALENSENGSKELCHVIETILHETGNYKGFNYQKWINGGRTKYFGPEYKRFYYMNNKIV